MLLLKPAGVQELSQLQDRVPGFPSRLARSIVEKQLGASLEDSFASFDLKPLAAASLGQVPALLPEVCWPQGFSAGIRYYPFTHCAVRDSSCVGTLLR